jgi:hypothetical protein
MRASVSIAASILLMASAGCAPSHVASVRGAAPSPQGVDAEVFLIGDAGSTSAAGTLTALTRAVRSSAAPKDRIRVLFLGDNIYPAGMPDSSVMGLRLEKERILDAQIAVLLAARVQGYFIPGNHDWDRMGPDGVHAIARQQLYVATHSDSLATLVPADGCPGPYVTEVGRTLRLVLLDSEWWLRAPGYERPVGCAAATREAVRLSIQDVLGRSDRYALVAAHHPIESGGRHGGYYSWRTHVFPFRELNSNAWIPVPVVGTLYQRVRTEMRPSEDLNGALYEALKSDLYSAFEGNPPLVYAAGHEHNLQVLSGSSGTNLLVSGSGAETTELRRLPDALYANAAKGFMRATFYADASVQLTVYELGRDGAAHEAYARWLTRPPARLVVGTPPTPPPAVTAGFRQ